MAGDGNGTGFPKLNETNYADWSMLMEAVLVRKQLWEVVNGERERPMGSENSTAVRSFVRKQAEARAEIVLHVETSQLPYVQKVDPAQIWENLRTIHHAHGFTSRLTLCRKFLGLTKRDEQPMQNWIAEVQHAACRLQETNVEVPDEDFILVETQGLPVSYDNLVVSLDASPPEMLIVDHAIRRLLNEEVRQIGHKSVEVKTEAFSAYTAQKQTPIEHITCFNCQKKGHYRAQCPDLPKEHAGVVVNADEDGVW
jgi:hypothetical protein